MPGQAGEAVCQAGRGAEAQEPQGTKPQAHPPGAGDGGASEGVGQRQIPNVFELTAVCRCSATPESRSRSEARSCPLTEECASAAQAASDDHNHSNPTQQEWSWAIVASARLSPCRICTCTSRGRHGGRDYSLCATLQSQRKSKALGMVNLPAVDRHGEALCEFIEAGAPPAHLDAPALVPAIASPRGAWDETLLHVQSLLARPR